MSLELDHRLGINRLRQRDIDEWVALGGNLPWVQLQARDSGWTDVRVALNDADNILVMFGVFPYTLDPSLATGWLIGTELGQKEGKALHRFHRQFLKEMDQKYDALSAITIHRDDRWHEALGFHHVETYAPGTHDVPVPSHLYVRT